MDEDPVLEPVSGAHVWRGAEMADRQAQWVLRFTDDEIAEVETALEAVESRGVDVVGISAENFPLPKLTAKLETVGRELHKGRGFTLLRGLPIDRYSIEQTAKIYFGLGAYLGEAVSQNARGHALGHICDLGFDWSLPTARGYQTADKLNFHTDPTDVVGLLCLRKSVSGGESYIVSSAAVFNAMLDERPDLVRVLTQTIYRDRRGEIPEGRGPWYRLPVFNFADGKLVTNYVRSTINKAQRFEQVPRLSEQQLEALALIERIASDPRLTLKMIFEPGDIQLLNNYFIMHSRTAYEDHPDPQRRRHLLRLWLACEDAPALPSAYYEFMGKTRSGRPNGYLMSGVDLVAPLSPEDGGPGDSAQRITS